MNPLCNLTAVPSIDSKSLRAAVPRQVPMPTDTGLVDVARCFHLRADFRFSWGLDLQTQHLTLRPGDLVLTGRHVVRTNHSHGTNIFKLELTPPWIASWLQRPEQLAGRLIPGDAGWGKVLSAFVAQIAPKLNADAQMPGSLIPQHIGSLLSLVEIELLGELQGGRTVDCRNKDRVCDLIRQRASEPGLTAGDVARSVGVSERTLHRAMHAAGQTFGETLLNERVDIAKRMLQAGNFARLNTAEIGFRAGFADPSYFVRAFTRKLGRTPSRYRSAWSEGRRGSACSNHEGQVSFV